MFFYSSSSYVIELRDSFELSTAFLLDETESLAYFFHITFCLADVRVLDLPPLSSESEDEPPPPPPPPREPTPEPPLPPEATAWLRHDRSMEDRLPEPTPVTATFDLYIDSVRFIPDNAVFCKVGLLCLCPVRRLLYLTIVADHLQLGTEGVVSNVIPKDFWWCVGARGDTLYRRVERRGYDMPTTILRLQKWD